MPSCMAPQAGLALLPQSPDGRRAYGVLLGRKSLGSKNGGVVARFHGESRRWSMGWDGGHYRLPGVTKGAELVWGAQHIHSLRE